MNLRKTAVKIALEAIDAVKPDAAVRRALSSATFDPAGEVDLVATGKAAWRMAAAASEVLGGRLARGIVVTKYGHVEHPLPRIVCHEAGHPVPDENSFRSTEAVLDFVKGLSPRDTVVFLLSGGGSALFEAPLVSGDELADVTRQLLACGADIVEINTIRKRLSRVKGGRFAAACAPAHIFQIVLSDVLGDPLDMIASGPAAADASTCAQAQAVVEKYGLVFTPAVLVRLAQETPREVSNVDTVVAGSVRELCAAAASACAARGYVPEILDTTVADEARVAGRRLAEIVRAHANDGARRAFIVGGETVVKLTGRGKGGRNQEFALAAASVLDGLPNVALVSVGSDGTDGPTDAAGGCVDGETAGLLLGKGISIDGALAENDAYPTLAAVDGLVVTGPTGTNVNDVAIGLVGA
ncbi:MAG: DUF4147 domain-containing protein [Kiritimatiellae bacterium]|nr:DUF4147 domain-containing protein [Kiritimatiellia bacterium]